MDNDDLGGYRDGILSRTTTISGERGCKASERWCDGRRAKSPCTRARASARVGARAHDGRPLNEGCDVSAS